MSPRSFRFRLILLVMLVLAPTGVLVLVANVERLQAEKARIRQQAVCAAKLAASSQAYYVKQTRQLLATMTEFPFLVLLNDAGMARTGMANLKLISPDFEDFGLIERDGTVFCRASGTNRSEGATLAGFAKQVLVNPAFAMSDLQCGTSGAPALFFAYPVYKKDRQLARVMYASIKVPLLTEALADIPVPWGGVVTVMDRAGNIVAQHPRIEGAIGTRLTSFPALQNAMAKRSEVYESESSEEVKQVYAVSTVNDGTTPLLYIQVAAPEKTLFAETDARFGASLVGFLLIAMVLLFLAWMFAEHSFLRPARAMLDATERLIEGDLSARTRIARPTSELHVLARRFDVMAETLAGRQKELEAANEKITRNNAELERRVQERTEDLQTLNRELEAFSYSVSHDLRAPLRHMDGFAQMLAAEPTLESNGTAQRYLGLITKSAKQMGTLIDDLLAFSRMARQPMAVEKVDSNKMVHGIIEEVTSYEPGRRIEWEVQSLPPVRADSAMMRQVWVNLISNAVKYTKGRDPAKIRISSHAENNETVFAIVDNGAGFNMAYADKLFGVFQRLHGESEFPGTGIGLANVRRIITRHGGRTWAKGEVGKGAEFYFSLPS